MKNLKVFGLILFISFAIYLFLYLRPRDYDYLYKVDDYTVNESYYKEYGTYFFEIEKSDIVSVFHDSLEYHPNHMLVDSVKEIDKNCILVNYASEYEIKLCNEDGVQVSDKYLNGNKVSDDTPIVDANQLKIYNYNKGSIAIWNYKGFDLYYEKGKSSLNFNKDILNTELITQYKKYLYIPNYNQEYYFNELYVLDMSNGKYDIIKFEEYELSFDSRVLGIVGNKIYYLDVKEKKEYSYDIKTQELELIGSEIMKAQYYDSQFKEISITKLINNNEKFKNIDFLDYKVIDDSLYLTFYHSDYIVRLEKKNGIKLLRSYINGVLYLEDDNLYYYDLEKGEILLAKYFEWNFNSDNKIFVTN